MEGRRLCASFAVMLLLVVGITPAGVAKARTTQAATCVYDHLTLKTDPAICRPRARAYPGSVRGTVKRSIYDSALIFGVPYATLLAVARCESGLNPRARNGTYLGLFQFDPATFKRASRAMRGHVGIRASSYWNPLDASYAAGYMFVTGQAQSWSCITSL